MIMMIMAKRRSLTQRRAEREEKIKFLINYKMRKIKNNIRFIYAHLYQLSKKYHTF